MSERCFAAKNLVAVRHFRAKDLLRMRMIGSKFSKNNPLAPHVSEMGSKRSRTILRTAIGKRKANLSDRGLAGYLSGAYRLRRIV